MTVIDARGPKPKYQQLREILLNLISTELKPNDAIPSEGELQERYGLSRMTIRKTVDQLVNENRLYRVAGVGTFVAEHLRRVELHLGSFSEDMENLGLRPSQKTTQLNERAADSVIAAELEVPVGDAVLFLERVRFADRQAICFEQSYLPKSLVPAFIERWDDGSLFKLLDREYELRPNWSEQRIGAINADAAAADALEVPEGSALLAIKQRAFKDSLLVEYCISLYRPDKYELAIVLNSSGLALTPRMPRNPGS